MTNRLEDACDMLDIDRKGEEPKRHMFTKRIDREPSKLEWFLAGLFGKSHVSEEGVTSQRVKLWRGNHYIFEVRRK